MYSGKDLIMEKDERMYTDDFKWLRYLFIGLAIFMFIILLPVFFLLTSQNDLIYAIFINLTISIIFAIPLGLLTFIINYYKNRFIQIKFDIYNREITWVNKLTPDIVLKKFYFSEVTSILIQRMYYQDEIYYVFLILENGCREKLLSGDKNGCKRFAEMISTSMQRKLEGKNSFMLLNVMTIAVIGALFFPIAFSPVASNGLVLGVIFLSMALICIPILLISLHKTRKKAKKNAIV